jgi:restriction endonuclease Mrr
LLLLALLAIVLGAIALVDWFDKHPLALLLTAVLTAVVLLVGGIFVILIVRQRKQARLQAEEERRERARRWQAERQEQARQREAAKRSRIEAMLHPDRVRDEVHYMSGPEFERFMADLLRQKGYDVEETPLSGDQGVDLILPDLDGKRVVIQLKRWTGPVGNKAIQATFAGMAHYQADEGWIITTSTFTKSARELARSTSVRLIDRDELADWLEGLREEGRPGSGRPDSVKRQAQRRRRRRRR